MKVRVRGYVRDMLAFRNLVPKRKKRIASSPASAVGVDPINQLARRLHPGIQHLVVAGVRDETRTTKTFKLVADPNSPTRELAYFRAGQYLSLKVEVNGVRVTRPYSISSAPFETLGDDGFYEVTVRRRKDGFFTTSIWENWKVGTKVRSSGPCGAFYHEPLRDAAKIVGLAGGSGITPFRSMARAIARGELEAELLLLYGSSDDDDVVFEAELSQLARKTPDKIRVVHVSSAARTSRKDCERGFITADLIRKYADVGNSSFFVCGPQRMYQFVDAQLATLDLPRKRIRREVFGELDDVTRLAGFPREVAGSTFSLKANVGEVAVEVPAKAAETVLVALERANLAPPSECRSGECGFCRALLVSGDVYIAPDNDGRRAADKRFGYVHPCVSYPITNIEVTIPRGA